MSDGYIPISIAVFYDENEFILKVLRERRVEAIAAIDDFPRTSVAETERTILAMANAAIARRIPQWYNTSTTHTQDTPCLSLTDEEEVR